MSEIDYGDTGVGFGIGGTVNLGGGSPPSISLTGVAGNTPTAACPTCGITSSLPLLILLVAVAVLIIR